MSRSRFLWSTSAALAALAALGGLGGCSDDSCGTHGAPATIAVAGDAVTITYSELTSLAANDCTLPGMPDGVVSISIEGTQIDGNRDGRITLCIPRPDQLNAGMKSVGTAISTADVRIIDLHGSFESCTFTLDSATLPTGTGGSEGVCANGTDAAGFALDLDAGVMMKRTCGATIDTVPAVLRGRVAIAKRN
jgi:hypothetical protein